MVVATRLGIIWLLLLAVGLFGGALGWRGGAFLMLAGLRGNVAGHLLMGSLNTAGSWGVHGLTFACLTTTTSGKPVPMC